MRNTILVLSILALPSAALLLFSQMTRTRATEAAVFSPSPAAASSAQPNLVASEQGGALLSWIESAADGGYLLWYSRWESGSWSAARTIASGRDWFVNWADFPALAAVDDRFMAAHFLQLSGPRSYDYDIRLTRSLDGGATWEEPLTPHRDGISAEHGFVSLLPWQDRLAAVWLDGRHSGEGHGEGAMTLRFATLARDGGIDDETELDNRVCDCCQTSAARTSRGIVVAYRDRSPDEIRDISVVRWENGEWSQPVPVHADHWRIGGCPVNGPALAARGEKVAVAWFTQSQDTPQVRLAFSNDGGRHFAPPLRVDDGQTMGRVGAVMLPDSSVIVSWLEFVGEEGVEIRLRRIDSSGRRSPSFTLTETDSSRRSGFPRMALAGQDLLMAWTRTGPPSRVETARVRVEALALSESGKVPAVN